MIVNKTKWVRLGDYIEEYNQLNLDNTIKVVKSVSVTKEFKDTGAKVNKSQLLGYKIVPPMFIAYVQTTSNEKCFACALNRLGKSIVVTSVNKVLGIKDGSKLSIEYLYLFLTKPEFDRYARFHSWGSARETFSWEELCRVRIPLPSMEVQRELVATYEGLKRLAEDNEALIAPLTEACQAFIVDCKRQYPSVPLGDYIEEVDERNTEGKYSVEDVMGISIDKMFIDTKANMEGVALTPYKLVKPSEFCYVSVTSRNGGKISLAINSSEQTYIVSSSYEVFKCIGELLPEYLYILLSRGDFDRYARFNSWGSARETFSWEELCRVEIPLPPPEVQQSIVNLYHCIEEAKSIARDARERLTTLCPALVQYAINA